MVAHQKKYLLIPQQKPGADILLMVGWINYMLSTWLIRGNHPGDRFLVQHSINWVPVKASGNVN